MIHPAELYRDARHGWRAIIRMPAVAAVVALSLGAGIGVNTLVFSWIQSRVFKPLPGVTDGSSFYGIEAKTDGGLYPGASWPEYRDLRANLRSFESIIAGGTIPVYVGEPGNVERVFGLIVSENYFHALGVQPALGRLPSETEMSESAGDPFTIISYSLWQRRYGGDPAALGRTIRVNGADLAIAAIVPDEFQGTTLGLHFDVYVPVGFAPLATSAGRAIDNRAVRGFTVLGRLPDDVSRDQAQAEVDGLMAQLQTAYPAENAQMRAEVLPFWQSPRGPQRMIVTALVVLQGIMLLLLLAVCGNTANLMLARASTRQREVGIRLALGAPPARIASLLLAETVILALIGAAVGALIAAWGTSALKLLPLTGLPIRIQTSVDATGLVFSMGLGLLCGLAVGAAPAWMLARIDPLNALRAGAVQAGRSALRATLMGAQVALALVVLVGAALFLGSFLDTRTIDPGFEAEGVLLAAYDFTGRRSDPASQRQFAQRLIERLEADPDIERAAIASSVPLDIHGLPSRVFTLEGRTRTEEGYDEALTNIVTPGYFDVMGIALVEGGGFAQLLDTNAPAQAIVNEEFVRRFADNGPIIGRRLTARGGPAIIAGVVRTTLYNAFGEPPTPAIYFSYRDRPQGSGEMHIRSRPGSDAALARRIRAIVMELDPELPVFNVRSLPAHVDTNLIFRKIPAQMFTVLGPMLLVLVSIGIYAVVAYNMSLRRTEIGVRLAIGGSQAQVVRQFVADSMETVVAGAAIGWLIALIVAFDAASPDGIDARVFLGVPALLLAVALFACWWPVRRAAQLDPWTALRDR